MLLFISLERLNVDLFLKYYYVVEAVETNSVSQLNLASSYFSQFKNPLEEPKVSDITAQIALVLDITTVFIATIKVFKMVARQALMDVFCCLVLLIMETGERGKCDP